MRFSRPCYDKPHRCPGWAGGGMHYPRGRHKKSYCENGSIRTRKPEPDFPGEFVYPGVAKWRFGHCTKCDVVTWPWATRRLDPSWWKYEIRWMGQTFMWKLEDWGLWHRIPGQPVPSPISLRVRWNRLRYHLTGSMGKWKQEDVDRIREQARERAEKMRGYFE